MQTIQPVILAGGTGSRLWPLSREMYPKQLLSLTDQTSLLQTTVSRVSAVTGMLPPIIVVGEEHRFITKSQIDELGIGGDYTILLEPVGRNTAPAISGAVQYIATMQGAKDQVILVLPADHLVRDLEAFEGAVRESAQRAAEGAVVTFGIEPERPETGYGYIECGAGGTVKSFREKPPLEVAEKYLAEGNYYWNSGMFAFTAETFIEEMKLYAPAILDCMNAAVADGEP